MLAATGGIALASFSLAVYRRPFATLRELLHWRLRLAGAREQTVVVRGLPVRYFTAGRTMAGCEALVLVHGLGDSAEGWARVLPTLARDRQVIALDLAGFGRTPIPPEGMHFEVLLDYLTEALDVLGYGRVALAGNSLGGALAIRFAARHPERTGRLFLLDSMAFASALPRALEPKTRELARELVKISAGIGTPLPGFILDDLIRRAHDPARRAYLANVAPLDLTDDLRGLTLPVTVIWGARDQLAPLVVGERIRDLAPDAELIVLPGTGHTPQTETPRQVIAIMRARLPCASRAPAAAVSSLAPAERPAGGASLRRRG
jgi:pimeloyl-ACP methyl ester carboxylesterase